MTIWRDPAGIQTLILSLSLHIVADEVITRLK